MQSLVFQDTDKFVEELVTPVLNCLSDPEVRVRLFASESLYNIVKVARHSIIPLFPRIFSSLSRLVTGKFVWNLSDFSKQSNFSPICLIRRRRKL